MKINKEYLEDKLKYLISQRSKVNEQLNETITAINKIEGAIDTINLLMKDLNKVDTEVNN